MAAAPRVRLQLDNIHCSSCVVKIEDLLTDLGITSTIQVSILE